VTNRRVNAIAGRLSLRSPQRRLPEVSVKIEKLEDFIGRARKLARLADAGKPIPESFVISFEDPADMLSVLTPARLALFRVIKQNPGSIASIAQTMKRDRSAVTRDVAALDKAGLVTVTEKKPSGSRTDERSARPR
jgi:predicted transcriptional regulator